MTMPSLSRTLFLGSALAVVLLPHGARADDVKKYRIKARLRRVSDLKEARAVTAIVPVGKTVTVIDGERDYRATPMKINGLKATFTVKPDGTMLAIHCDAVFRDTQAHITAHTADPGTTETQGQIFVEASTNIDVTLAPGDFFDVPFDVNGTPFVFTFTAQLLT
jgi:hypothetical protein